MHERILVADDEPDIADLVCLYLQNENYETRVCYSGQEALEEVRREKPDLAILDIMMPGVSGLTVCREIRKKIRTRLFSSPQRGRRSTRSMAWHWGRTTTSQSPSGPWRWWPG